MVSANDSNYVNLLIAVTDAIMSEFAATASHQLNSRARKQCDSLVSLWISVLLNNGLKEDDRALLVEHITEWKGMEHCPKENADDSLSKRNIFDIVGEACCPTASDNEGKYITHLDKRYQINLMLGLMIDFVKLFKLL